MKLKMLIFIALNSLLFNCQKTVSNDSEEKATVKIPTSVLESVPANMAIEQGNIINAIASQVLKEGGGLVNLQIKCEKKRDESINVDANVCRINFTGNHIKIGLSELFFNLAAGEVHIGRENSKAAIWVRTFDQPELGLRTIEYCKLEGIEAGVGISFGSRTWAPGYPDIEGLRVVLKKQSNANGSEVYKAVDAILDISYLGTYPNKDCDLTDDKI
jgi:hypothetical protein